MQASRTDAKSSAMPSAVAYPERPNIHGMSPYTPGEQPSDPSVIKLNTNENPYPPAPAVMTAIAQVPPEALRRYPSPNADAFRNVAARLHGLSPDHVIATNGGDELLRLVVTTYCQPAGPTGRRGLGVAEPSYSLYQVLAVIQDTPIVKVPLNTDWSLPDDLGQQLSKSGCALAMIVNPHAPSGRLEPLDALERLARSFTGILLIDEAYVNFADQDALPLLEPSRKLNNLLLLRTLSKGYSLAGLRFGYGLGSPQIIATLNKAKDSYPTDALAQAAAAAALQSQDYARQTWQQVIQQRIRLIGELRRRGWQVPQSQSNFVLAQPPAKGPQAAQIYQLLKRDNILVRYFDQDRLRDKLRITVGSPPQVDALLAALQRYAQA